MPVDFQTVSVAFGQGIDSKSDPKAVVQGKLLSLQDGVFNSARAIEKRSGYDSLSRNIIGGGTLSNPKLVREYLGRLVCVDSGTVYDYSESASAWRSAGKYDSIEVSNTFISGPNRVERASSMVITGNYAIVTYDVWDNVADPVGSTFVGTLYSVMDLTTQAFLVNNQPILSVGEASSGGTVNAKMVLLGGTVPAVVYLNLITGLTIKTITISSGVVTLGTPTVLDTFANVRSYTSSLTQYPFYSIDIVETTAGATIAYSSSTAGNPINFVNVNTSATSTATGSIAAAGLAIPLSLVRDTANGNIWTYWGTPTSVTTAPGTGTTLNCAVLSSALAVTTAKFTVESGLSYLRQAYATKTSATTQRVYYTQVNAMTGTNAKTPNPVMRYADVTTSATSTGGTSYLTNLDIYGRPFSYGGKNYLPCVFYSNFQFCGYLIDLTDAHVAGKFLVGTAEAATNGTDFNSNKGQGGLWWRYPGSLALTSNYDTSKMIFSSGFILESQYANSLTNTPYTNTAGFLMGTCLVTFDFDSDFANQAVEANGVLALNGSLVRQYDGSLATELGYNYYPEIDYIQGVGGSLADGTYQYTAIYQWSDAQGNLYQSSPSPSITVTVTGGGGVASVAIYVKALSFSQKNDSQFPVSVLVYRTNNAGEIPYYINQNNRMNSTVYNGTGFTTVTDYGAASLQTVPVYTSGTAVLPNDATPPAMVLWVNNDRLWAIDSENPDINVYYSKTFSLRGGVNFTPLLVNVVDAKLGSIVGGSGMDEKTVLLKESGLMYFTGDGANDSGTGSTLSGTQVIPSDVGCENNRGILLLPDGLIFQSADAKGLYKLNRGLQVSYYGYEAAGYNSQNITAVQMIPNQTQVRMLSSDGTTIVYDYMMNQWGTFTNHLGYSSTVWKGRYVYVRTDGKIFIENYSTFLDEAASFALKARVAWLKASSLQNFQRIRQISMLGNCTGISGHGLKATCYFDFDESSPQATNAYSFSTSAAAFQYRAFTPRQKCDAMSFLIEEIVTGASGEFVRITDLGLEIGVKRGLNKQPSTRSVG